MNSLALRVNGKTVAVTPDQIDNQPDDSRQEEDRQKKNSSSYDPGRDRSRTMNCSSFTYMLFSTEDCQISIDRGSLSQREISHKDGCVSGDGMTRVNGKRAKRHGNIARYVSMDVNGAERAGYIAHRFSLGDGNVGTETGAVVIVVLVFGEPGKGKGESYRSQKDQPGGWKRVCAHEQPRG
jgi:hypothetical protein